MLAIANPVHAAEQAPTWAYPVNPPGFKLESDDGTIRRVPGSTAGDTLTQTRDFFITYAPVGSVRKGEVLVVDGGGGKTTPCAACHGPDLKGAAAIPPIAGRSPSHVVRQLHDIQSGARAGEAAALMKPVIQKLTVDDMAAIAAYLATRAP